MSSAVPARSLMSIGEVLNALRGDFPDVTISKIRFLESEGLVEPARTPSGYRKFSHQDVERLRYVLSAQRDQYLPLRVIKEHLEAIDRGHEVPVPPGGRLLEPGGGDNSEIRMSRSQLIEAAGIDADLLDQIENYGLVARRAGSTHYDGDALAVARAVAEMRVYGLEPRHLRAFRTGAEREAGLVEQVVAPLLRQRDPEARARAEEVVREMGALSVRLHTALVRTALRGFVER
jgi:DNA-binding transcriptional MerR regulator